MLIFKSLVFNTGNMDVHIISKYRGDLTLGFPPESYLNIFTMINVGFPLSARSFSRYHPSKGYWWEFKNQEHAGW